MIDMSASCNALSVIPSRDISSIIFEEKKTTFLKVNAIFKEVGVNNITVQVEKQSFFQHMCGLGFSTDQMIELAQHMTSLNQQETSNFIKAI